MKAKRKIALTLALAFLLTLCACSGQKQKNKTVIVLEDSGTESAQPVPTAGKDWYGWWKMDHTSGDWAHMYGYYWDCCAELSEEDGKLSLLLWDENLPKEDFLARAALEKRGGGLCCTDGSFLDRELDETSWDMELGEDAAGALLTIRGDYDAVGKGGFRYEIYLRPWGCRWPGAADERPYWYESWYLPLIEQGSAMPEEIGKGGRTN